MKKIRSFIRRHQSILIASLAFTALLFGTYRYTIFKKGQWEKDIRNSLLENLIGKKSALEKALYSRIYYTRGVAGFVSLKPDVTMKEFEQLAAEFIKGDSVISSMALSKDCIIGAIYPLEGHEEAIGLNLLAHPERREIVEKTIETHETFVAGPVELVEGGIAFISYTPIFDKTDPLEEKFWGVCDIVILRDRLMQEAGITEKSSGISYALRGYNGTGFDGNVFWGVPETFSNHPVTISIELPYGNWILAASPEKGWGEFLDQDKFLTTILFFSVLIISVLIYLFTRAVLQLKINERNLRQTTKRLAESNALKDKLFSIISHDLRNPLGTFLNLTEILVTQHEDIRDDRRKEMLESLQESASGVYALLENLLEWSRTQKEDLQPLLGVYFVYPTCQEIIQLMEISAKVKNITIQNKVDKNLQAVFDEEMTKTILRNFLSNAIKFTPFNGSVTLSSRQITKNEITYIEIRVQDTGNGIPPEDLSSLFDFSKAISRSGTNNERGSGIGLVISKEFAEKQGGFLKVDSSPGNGSVFSLLLPEKK